MRGIGVLRVGVNIVIEKGIITNSTNISNKLNQYKKLRDVIPLHRFNPNNQKIILDADRIIKELEIEIKEAVIQSAIEKVIDKTDEHVNRKRDNQKK